MSVVNVKVKFIRPKYNNLKEWMQDPNNVYIGRRGIVFIDGERFPKQDSIWCNPFKITNSLSRDECLIRYKTYIKQKLINKELDITLLQGKNLGCWCAPNKCHGNILQELLLN